MPVVPAIIIIYILTLSVVFFSFFTAKIAQMKLRRASWGILGAVLGPIGLVVVCYLPSRRKDGKETNLIRSAVRALPGLSRKLIVVLGILLVLVLVALQLMTAIPKWQENREYAESIGTAVTDKLMYTSVVKGTPVSVITGTDSTYLITEDGDLYGWGYNNLCLNQQDKGVLASNVKDVAQLERTVYLLKKDNKLYKINEDGSQVEFAGDVAQVACGPTYGVFIKNSGDVYVWGDNSFGQLGSGVSEYTDEPVWLVGSAKDVACGARHLLILKTNGAVVACGSNVTGALGVSGETGTLSLKQIAENCKAIAAGSDFSLILTNDGVLKSVGANESGQLGRVLDAQAEETEEVYLTFGEVATGVDAIGAGGKSGWYLADGTLYTWGENHCGQLSTGNTDGQVTPVKALDKVDATAMSADHLAVISDGRLYTCGDNTYGQLGETDSVHLSLYAVVSVKG